ncbi:MAG: hypothetical protein KDB18_03010 [Salinibacterium sp.]|nr:hypothetical protein [Micrococcales bacterium]MCB1280472.1 hypothetical protein [Salinibacterium sp.]
MVGVAEGSGLLTCAVHAVTEMRIPITKTGTDARQSFIFEVNHDLMQADNDPTAISSLHRRFT